MAENLCGLQVKQFRKEYGIIKNVSDRDYVSNSFHCHVTEDITPITKQNREYYLMVEKFSMLDIRLITILMQSEHLS